MFGDDSTKVFKFLEEATRGTVVVSTIAPYKRNTDGRGIFFAIVSQHAGVDKWEGVIKTSETFLKSFIYSGNINYTLEKHYDGHHFRTAFFSRKLLSMLKFSSQLRDLV